MSTSISYVLWARLWVGLETLRKSEPTVREVWALKRPGVHRVGTGLYLQIAESGARSYLLRYRLNRRSREMGLGSFDLVGLAEAREMATEYRKLVKQGIDPIDHRNRERVAVRIKEESRLSFEEAAQQYITANEVGWRNPKHRQQWRNTLATYVYPAIGGIPVGEIKTPHVLTVLNAIWQAKPETASRVRGRIETVLDWAKANGFREGENPAQWRGHLSRILPSPKKLATVEHHAALSYDEMPTFFAEIRSREALTARALEFLILTAARSGEVRGTKWDEIDLEKGVWTVPAARMKAAREHRVPLSPQSQALLKVLSNTRTGPFVFPSLGGRQLSEAAFGALLKRMGRDTITAHGFRSTFRQWCAEQTNFSREAAEAALAHVLKDKVEAAYQRGDLFGKRTKLMGAWANYCGSKDSQVIPFRAQNG